MARQQDDGAQVQEASDAHPAGWTPADALLEARLDADEARLAVEERWIRRNWLLALVLALTLLLTIAALVVSVVALNRDIDTVARAAPKDDSVGTAALQSGAVTADKISSDAVTDDQLAPDSVTEGAIAAGAVTEAGIAAGAVGNVALAPEAVDRANIAAGAVTGRKVAADTLTGANIVEASLAEVPRATAAAEAGTARNARRLGGLRAGLYLSSIQLVQAASEETFQPIRTVTARCPADARIVGGGAVVDATGRGIAIVASAPDAEDGWVAVAEDSAPQRPDPWRLVVTAICVAGGGGV
jgi:hypothetical protein